MSMEVTSRGETRTFFERRWIKCGTAFLLVAGGLLVVGKVMPLVVRFLQRDPPELRPAVWQRWVVLTWIMPSLVFDIVGWSMVASGLYWLLMASPWRLAAEAPRKTFWWLMGVALIVVTLRVIPLSLTVLAMNPDM